MSYSYRLQRLKNNFEMKICCGPACLGTTKAKAKACQAHFYRLRLRAYGLI